MNASRDNASEAYWHAVRLAQAGQQYYSYSSLFDSAEYPGEIPPCIRTQHGCMNVINLPLPNVIVCINGQTISKKVSPFKAKSYKLAILN